MTPVKINKLKKPTGLLEASSSSSRKQEQSSIEKTTEKLTRKKPSMKVLNPESINKVRELLEKELGTTIQEATRRGRARGSGLRPEAAPSASFQAQAYNVKGDCRVGSPQSSTAPIPGHGTEAEPRREFRKSEYSVDAAERNVWHVSMNKHGVYRPSGELRCAEDATMQWREAEKGRWYNAAKHGDIRGQLLAECAQLGEYTYPQDKRTAVDSDITAFHPESAISDQKFCPDTRKGTIQTQSIRCKSGSKMARLFLTTTTILSSTSRICQRPSRRRLKVAFKRPSLDKIPGSTSMTSGSACPRTRE